MKMQYKQSNDIYVWYIKQQSSGIVQCKLQNEVHVPLLSAHIDPH